MPFSPATFKGVINERGLSNDQAASIAGMSLKKLMQTFEGENTPTKNQILKLAERLAVPPYAFFVENFKLPPSKIIDFRASKPVSLQYGKDSSKFEYLFHLQDFLSLLYTRLDLDAPDKIYSAEADENPEQFAKSVEGLIGLKEIRESAQDKNDFYRKFRKSIESLGVYVIQDHNISLGIDGFALYHENFTSNMIFVNSGNRNAAAKCFTLAHELSHIFGKRSAISNNYEYDNEVEAYANEFAASLIIPREDLLEEIGNGRYSFADYDFSKRSAIKLSEIFKCSVSAMMVRLSRLGFVKGSYTSQFLSGFSKKNFPDAEKPQSYGPKTGPKPGVIDLAHLGARATMVLVLALEKGVTSKYEIFENTGLSKKRIEGLVEVCAAKKIYEEHKIDGINT
ncbi:ImmA/IrrE family metallo-endopeptidase [Agrobacterium sp. P15N1-A]|uniref:ImmA/IrrE family metallo-endopeptidase n=1 Tax=Agrobacterium sp. P15N1-A TaxID=3342820 RepID=UPI0037D18BF5